LCGIVGRLSGKAEDIVPDRLSGALTCIKHRGPDETNAWYGNHVSLGSCRLSIIDLANGQQPIWSEDKAVCIVFNGEIYNFLDLRPQLEAKGHQFRTHCDTEVILHAYEEWGMDCLKRLNGMFAFAIWDSRTESLILARDRIGEKPLYYYHDAQQFVFASEIKALFAVSEIPRALSSRGLVNYLSFGHAVAPQTIYSDIKKLLPGHYIVVRDRQLEVKQYWDVGDEPQVDTGQTLTEAEYARCIRELLEDSVRRRLIADVPVGAFLSGGVDSSVIVGLMARYATGPVKTFSLGFTIGGAYNELPDARRVADHFGTDHHELLVQHSDLVRTLRTLVYHYDEPFGDAAGFPLYLLSQFTRQHVKVVLAGDGGDELFGGYRRYAADRLAAPYQHLPEAVTRHLIPSIADAMPRLRRIKRTVSALQIVDPARRYAAWLTYFTPEMQAELFLPELLGTLAGYDPAEVYSTRYVALPDGTANDHLNRLMYIDLKTWLPDTYMEKVDKVTMACSLEGRLPFLDHRLVELAFQIPGRLKIRGRTMKRVFKKAVRDLVPSEVLRKPKHGFSVPIDHWFRDELKAFAFEVLFDERTRRRNMLNMTMIERLWKEHLNGRHVWDTHLWLLLNLELWQRIYLDGEPI